MASRAEPRPKDVPSPQGLAFLGAVAGGLVHEIRNPLSTINVTLQLLQEDWQEHGEDSRAQRTIRRLKSLRGEVIRLEGILDDFLRYAGIRRLHLGKADINRIVGDVTAFILPECARARVDLAFYPDQQIPLVVVDERLLKQALLNLLLNAIQAMEGHGEVEGAQARPHQLIIRTRVESDAVRIDVIDNGPGIPSELQDRVWEVYFSRRRGGSGLGLPTARRIVEEHGGQLSFETEVGKGSDFILRLPISGPPQVDAQP
jgi:signal transduction histidine kinase